MNNSFKLANTIGFIDDDLIADAEEFRTSSKKPVYIRCAAAAAACLCVAGGAAVLAKNRTASDPVISGEFTNSENPWLQGSNVSSADLITPDLPTIKMSSVYFNETSSANVGGERRYYDPEKYDTISWDKQAVLEYFGKELAPAYIPKGLIPSSCNGEASVIAEKGGQLVYDTVGLSFYHDYYEDGSAKLTENVAAIKGFSMEVSKLGMPFHCGCFSGLKDTKATEIRGTDVLFGHYPLPYGPFDPETHEPSGYYDVFVAEFELDGISYRVITDQLASEEIVKIVSSIIYGNDCFSVE